MGSSFLAGADLHPESMHRFGARARLRYGVARDGNDERQHQFGNQAAEPDRGRPGQAHPACAAPGVAAAGRVVEAVTSPIVVNHLIVESIEDRRRLSFSYHGKRRIAEPQCYGIGTRGTELLRAHQIQGGLQREPLFDVSKMRDLVVLDRHFIEPGPNYKKNDSAMKTIFAQL
jgi:hypothetical protein